MNRSSSRDRRRSRSVWRTAAAAGLLAVTGVACSSSAPPEAAVVDPIPSSELAAHPPQMVVHNGGWCWFQGARILVTSAGDLLVGSTPSTAGAGGRGRGGAIEVTTVDLDTGKPLTTDRLYNRYRSDDHVSPGLVELPSGRIVASWAGHNDDSSKRSAILDPASTDWSLNPALVRKGVQTSYSNLIDVPTENGGRGRLYDFYRGEKGGHNALVSDDGGRTWTYAGTLVWAPAPLTPYVRYSTAVGGRIYFVASTGNPQQANGSSVRAGYLEAGRVYTSAGREIGSLATGGVQWDQLTPVDAGIPAAAEGDDTDVWTADIVATGTDEVTAVLTVTHPDPSPAGGAHSQEYRYARWTGTRWEVRHLAWGGSELYAGQPSYSGLAVIDPADPERVYLSSNVDPRTGLERRSASDGRSHWEIYEATSTAPGWSISAVTADSTADNIRPVVARGTAGFALAWMRGTYTDFHTYDTGIVVITTTAD